MHQLFLNFSVEKLRQLEERIETCLDRLSDDDIWWRADESNNSVGNLVLHLSGNVRQWIITSIGGKADVRDRDGEFHARGAVTADELKLRLSQTITEATHIISGLTPERLTYMVRVQGYQVSALEAIYHVVEHFALHAGQIMYITKFLRKEDLAFYSHLNKPAHTDKTP